MLTKRLIACFDVVDGRVTKAQQFQDNIDVAPAEELAQQLYADQIDEIVFYDIMASAREAQDRPRHGARGSRTTCSCRSRSAAASATVDDMFEVLKAGRREDQRRLDGGAQSRHHPRRAPRRSAASASC